MQNLIRYLRAASQSPRAKEREIAGQRACAKGVWLLRRRTCAAACVGHESLPRSFRVSECLGVRGIVHTINLVYKHITCPYIHVHRLFCNHSKRCDPERRCRRTTSVSVRELMEKYR